MKEEDVLDELRKIKDELSSRYGNVRDYIEALIAEQALRHPELAAQ